MCQTRRVTVQVPDLVRAAATQSPDRVALVEAGGRRVTWAELDAEVDAVAHGLNAHGLVAGYRVAVAMGNRIEFVTAYLGALRARLVAVPVNPRAATGEVVRIIADCGARLVLADPDTVIDGPAGGRRAGGRPRGRRRGAPPSSGRAAHRGRRWAGPTG